ncbi:MAG: disulfide bond formation protein B [Burkholderiales bacterium]|nr:disulfide bond formation protein B [Burkholderiales bacterium]MDE2565991.1 disulfide bond formation protein B [Burkholderiales bacterium]
MKPGAAQRRFFGGAIVASLAAVGAALVSQHVFDIMPCPWCILQRVIFVAIALAALPGLLPVRGLQRLAALLMGLLAMAGVASALWQHFVAAASNSCDLTLADKLIRQAGLNELWPDVFQPYASCADAAVKLLGVPYEFYSLALFLALAGAAAWSLTRRR